MSASKVGTIINHLKQTLCAEAFTGAPDEELLERFVAQRDETAFTALVRRHGPLVWGVCRRLLVHRQDAEDAFQATFLVLVRKAASLRQRQHLANWLFGVARRAALSARAGRTRRSRQEQSSGAMPDVQATSETPWEDVSAVLDEELARLPDKYRLPLLLCGLEGLSYAEAAKQLGWPAGTVAGRLSRARESLRVRLRRRGLRVSAATLGLVLTKNAAAAAVPPALLAASVQHAAALVAAGTSSAAGIPTKVAMLMHGVLRKMFLSRLLTTTVLVTVLALTLGGAGAIWHRTPPAETPPSGQADGAPERSHPSAAAPSAPPAQTAKPARAEEQGRPALRLPKDSAAVVLRLDRTDEMREKPTTSVSVHADGRVVAEVPDLGSDHQEVQVLEGKLSSQELQDLLAFVVHEQEFFAFDKPQVMAALMEEYEFDGNVKGANDTITTQIRIQIADRDPHEVKWFRLDSSSVWFREVKQVRQLGAVERRLLNLSRVLVAGGPERVEPVVKWVNDWVQRSSIPNAPVFTKADLSSVVPSLDGSRTWFTFSRGIKVGPGDFFSVTFDFPQQGEPRFVSLIPAVSKSPPTLKRRADAKPQAPRKGEQGN